MVRKQIISQTRAALFSQRSRFGWFLLLILVVGLLFHWPRVNTLVWSSDEGIHLSAAYLVNQGLEPYRQVSFSQGPLFLEMVRWPLRWWGGSDNDVAAVRLVMLAFGLSSLVATALIGRALKSNLAGWCAAALLLVMPSFFYFARAVMADGPAIALGMWAAWAAIRFLARGKRRWLMASGLLLGLSLATKFLTLYAVAWIPFLIFLRICFVESANLEWARFRVLTRDGVTFIALVIGALLAIYGWYDLPSLLSSAFGMRIAMRDAFGSWAANNRDEIVEFWHYHAPLLLLAGYGLFSQKERWIHHFLLGSWLLLIIVSLRVQNPLYHQHLQLLLPLVALLAGLGLATLVEQLQRISFRSPAPLPWSLAGTGIALTFWFGLFIMHSYQPTNRYLELSTTGLREGQEPIVAFLQKFTAPSDCVVTDDLNLAFISRRFPPAMLIDLSNARLATDSISDHRLERITLRAGCQAVAPLTDRITEYSPDFAAWSAETFLGSRQDGDGTTLWLGQPLVTAHPTLPLHVELGGELLLLGANLDVVQAEQTLYLSLYWQSLKPLTTDYKIFVHLRDSDNKTVVNGDHLPYDNFLPTTRWPVDRAVKETIQLTLPSAEALANYRLFIGVYHPDSQKRLAVENDESGENAIVIPVAWDLL
ncbi:MAG: glycosyltransferase family 39 protein [Caldilineaceae bacterium]|nr:glycosyltransferase family 39 protein [Caldilineaceae bacterium]